MLTFSVPAQILIETVASVFLLVCAVILTDGVLKNTPSPIVFWGGVGK